jgi:hypothetical protein
MNLSPIICWSLIFHFSMSLSLFKILFIFIFFAELLKNLMQGYKIKCFFGYFLINSQCICYKDVMTVLTDHHILYNCL